MEILYLLTQWKTENYIYDNIQKVEQVINYMMEYYTQPIKLKELADVISVSPSYIGSIFKSVTGKSPITYLIEIRLHKAKELLLDGHSVSDVAEEVGFNDLFYFSKCFKKFENLSPLQFKQIANNSSDTYIDSKF
ncbi:helix-turn-helix transcriptional regulator [Marispirochaeta sp.]|uniref:helix-turn-helix transcriptional regulator n=1 Tax=Marispirochaeta sp. TaxID=2038653 RepID=UPI0029C68B95|nr:helix-turn-helix transcriptional regulator [Marispirochaeta sp.]